MSGAVLAPEIVFNTVYPDSAEYDKDLHQWFYVLDDTMMDRDEAGVYLIAAGFDQEQLAEYLARLREDEEKHGQAKL